MSLPWSLLAVPPTPAGMVQAIVRTARERLVGQRVTLSLSDAEATMTVVGIDSTQGMASLALGRLETVRLVAADVTYGDLVATRLELTWHDAQLVPAPALVATPLEVTITVTPELVREQLRRSRPAVAPEFTDNGSVRLRWAHCPRLGYMEVLPQVTDTGGALVLVPRAVGVAGRRTRPPRKLSPIPVPTPWLPRNFRLTEVTTAGDRVVLRVVADRWHHRLSTTQLLDLLRQLTTTATKLSINWMRL